MKDRWQLLDESLDVSREKVDAAALIAAEADAYLRLIELEATILESGELPLGAHAWMAGGAVEAKGRAAVRIAARILLRELWSSEIPGADPDRVFALRCRLDRLARRGHGHTHYGDVQQ